MDQALCDLLVGGLAAHDFGRLKPREKVIHGGVPWNHNVVHNRECRHQLRSGAGRQDGPRRIDYNRHQHRGFVPDVPQPAGMAREHGIEAADDRLERLALVPQATRDRQGLRRV